MYVSFTLKMMHARARKKTRPDDRTGLFKYAILLAEALRAN